MDKISDQEIDKHRIAGEISLVLESGSDAEKAGLLSVIGQLCGEEEKNRLANQFGIDGKKEPL